MVILREKKEPDVYQALIFLHRIIRYITSLNLHSPMHFRSTFLLAGLMVAQLSNAQQQETLLLRSPSLSQDKIAFAYAGDIWLAGRDGANPRRITVNPDVEAEPMLSPDGKWIAFTGNYDGSTDVYLVSVNGGIPRRITYHPGSDIVRGWHGNDKILFSSSRESNTPRYHKLFEADINGGLPQALKMPEAHQGSISADGKYTAYIKNPDPTDRGAVYRPFKHYRGGNMPRIWIFNNQTLEITEVPAAGANNTRPVWLGNAVYFLSDRNGTTNVFRYQLPDKQVTQVTSHKDFDVKSLYADGKSLVYEQAGKIHLWEDGQSKDLHISLHADLPYKRPHWVGDLTVRNMQLSPTGVRAVVECRGEILTVPAEKGDVRNLTNTTGVHERDPAWSPDGKWIAYFSDESGEYTLKLRDQKAEKPAITISLGEPDFYYEPLWSPDSKKILYRDKHLRLYYIDIEAKKPVLIDEDSYDRPDQGFAAGWSADSRWITYQKRLPNILRSIFIYDVAAGKPYQVTDGRSEASNPTFSRDGKYLFFTASTNYALNTGWLDMTSYERETRSSIYAVVLANNAPSLLAPESDEETEKGTDATAKPAADTSKAAKEKTKNIRIDLENIDQRIVALSLPPRDYSHLNANVEGKLLYLEGNNLQAYDIAKRKSDGVINSINNYVISSDGKKLLYATGNNLGIVSTSGKSTTSDGKLNITGIRILSDPEAEWKQMFNELWRIERDFFYVANMHGADWKAVKNKYEKFLPYVSHREDLNYLFNEMMGELVIGHNYVGYGDAPNPVTVNVGLLGADYSIENGRYRFRKIYSGLNWNPSFVAPLTQPGIQVKEGDYLLAVNGIPLDGKENIYSLFQNAAGKQVRILVNSQPTTSGAKEYTVVPVNSETNLRNMDWIEGNRRKVDRLSNGQLAYVYMPNTGGDGYTFFNRYYFSQLDKKGVVLDERFNGGGSAADYVIDLLNRDLLNYWATRDGKPQTTPGNAIFGPKAMIMNGYAGSGGDLMPFLFREKKLGPLVGTTTMGILVGIYNYPTLMDGGYVTAPRLGIFSKDGKWIIENEGVTPDVEVEMTPADVIAGKDPQLEKAVELLMKEVKKTGDVSIPKAPVRAK
jgi:tricorn protease